MSAAFCPSCRHSRQLTDLTCAACGVERPVTGWPVDPMIGKVVDDKYRVEKRLSTGGFGTVFLATQIHGHQELGSVVLKFLHPELAHDPKVARRFVTEAKAARELTNSHVVRVFDLGFSEEGIPFMVQEYVAGEGLDTIMRSEAPLPAERAVRIAMQIAEAMDEAHGKGILHRDLKPENLRIQRTIQGDFVKVLDFGIARVERGTSAATNSFIGTPRYMPPEQIKQKEVDARSDIYALGTILFELLAGAPPIEAESEMEYIHLNLVAEPRDIRSLRGDLGERLAGLVMRMIAKEKEARPASMAIVYAELRGGAGRPSLPVGAGTLPLTRTETLSTTAGGTITRHPESRRRLVVGGIVAALVLAIFVAIGVGVVTAGGTDDAPPVQPPVNWGYPATAVTAPPMTTIPTPVTASPVTPTPDAGTTVAAPPETAAPRAKTPPRRPPQRPSTSSAPRVQKIDD